MILTVATTDEVAGAGKKSTNKADPGSCKMEFFFVKSKYTYWKWNKKFVKAKWFENE